MGYSKTVLTQVGRALKQLGIERVAACFRHRRAGRWDIAFEPADRLPKELKLAGMETIEAANRWLRKSTMAAHNKQFAIDAEQQGCSGSSPMRWVPGGRSCGLQEDRTVGNDNTVKWQRLSLQLPPSRLRAHFVKATVRLMSIPDGALAVYWGPHRLADYGMDGVLVQPAYLALLRAPRRVRLCGTRRIRSRPHCIPFVNAMPGHDSVDLWTTPSGAACADSASEPGCPQLAGRGGQQRKGNSVFCRTGTVPDDTLHGSSTLTHAPGVERRRSGQITSYKNRTG